MQAADRDRCPLLAMNGSANHRQIISAVGIKADITELILERLPASFTGLKTTLCREGKIHVGEGVADSQFKCPPSRIIYIFVRLGATRGQLCRMSRDEACQDLSAESKPERNSTPAAPAPNTLVIGKARSSCQ
jgi:hypothetical protein